MNDDQSYLITGNARVAGLQTDLHMTDKQYQICNTVIFVYVVPWNVVLKSQQHSRPYIVSELPSNLLFRKIGARFILPTTVVLWGIVATLQGQQLGTPYFTISPYLPLLQVLWHRTQVWLLSGRFLGWSKVPWPQESFSICLVSIHERNCPAGRLSHHECLFWRQLSLHWFNRIAIISSSAGVRYEISSQMFWL